MGFRILGTGSALPARSVTNDDLSEFLDTSDEWIFPRTGIRSRRICTTESLDELSVEASRVALEAAGVTPDQLDLIICSTTSGDHLIPAEACAIAELLGATCPAFDVSAACAGFVFALDVADGYFARGRAERVLVVAAGIEARGRSGEDGQAVVALCDVTQLEAAHGRASHQDRATSSPRETSASSATDTTTMATVHAKRSGVSR